jgi:hypothetical protein
MTEDHFDKPASQLLTRYSSWSALLIVCLSVFTLPPSLLAQDEPQKWVNQLEITPLVSYWGGLHLPTQPNSLQENPSIVLDAGPSYGFALGMRIHVESAIEIRWNRRNSYVSMSGVNVDSPKVGVNLNHLYCSFTHEYASGGRGRFVRPFLIASVGATKLTDSASLDSLGFSIGIGAGMKLLLSHHVGFRMQVEWLPTFWGQQGTVSCGQACAARIGGTLASQTEAAVGPIIRF